MPFLRPKKMSAEMGLIVICSIVILYSLYHLKNSIGGRLALENNGPSSFLVSVYQAQVRIYYFSAAYSYLGS